MAGDGAEGAGVMCASGCKVQLERKHSPEAERFRVYDPGRQKPVEIDPDIVPETSSLPPTKFPTFPPEWQSCFFETLPAPGLIDLPVSLFPVLHCSPVTGDLLSSTYEIK